MKKSILFFVALLAFLNGFAQGFDVNHTQLDIYIRAEGYFDVVEQYDLNFTEQKHGIFRDIQLKYDVLNPEGKQEKRRIRVTDIDVPNHKFSSDASFVQKLSDQLQIKIGDKKVFVIGPQHYEIKYRVYDAFIFQDSLVQFYWNVKPPGWNAIFKQMDFNIHLPNGVDLNTNDLFVYAGAIGDTVLSTNFDIKYANGVFSAKSGPYFLSAPRQSVTVLLNLPKTSVAEIKPAWPFWTNYGWTLILGAMLFFFYRIWNKYGKDDKVVAAISYFPPKDVDPAMAGFLLNDIADTPDLISLIPYWGANGFIAMEQIPKEGWFGKEDTKLTRLRSLSANAPNYEQTIFNGLFGANGKEVLVSSLKDTFYTKMDAAKTQLKAKAQIYYEEEAKKVQTKTIVGILILGLSLAAIFLFTWGIWAALSAVLLMVFLLAMSFYLVKKNAKGNEVLSELKGFKQFIKVAEENKLKMLLQDDPSYFETTMGFALAFGLFSQWARKFEVLNLQPPSWYTSSGGAFTMHNFSQSFSSSMSSAQSTMVSAPSSSGSGGGSSGGGFGGGGGGSW